MQFTYNQNTTMLCGFCEKWQLKKGLTREIGALFHQTSIICLSSQCIFIHDLPFWSCLVVFFSCFYARECIFTTNKQVGQQKQFNVEKAISGIQLYRQIQCIGWISSWQSSCASKKWKTNEIQLKYN